MSRGVRGQRPHLGAWPGLALGLLISLAMVGCIVRARPMAPRLTGTCEGVCAHYLGCKPGHGAAERQRCVAECPEVFSDRASLMAYESLSCDDAVEYVDGETAKTVHISPTATN